MSSPFRNEWIQAMKDEIESIQSNQVWELVDLPPGQKALKSRWVFHEKRNEKGEIVRRKARFVCCGYEQREHIDHGDTFAPVARLETVRLLLSLAARFRMTLTQFDVKCAFLSGDIDRQIFVRQPALFEDGTSRVCLLKRSLYGLKQSPKLFNEKIKSVLRDLGLAQNKAENSLYMKLDKSDLTLLVLYTDDGLIASTRAECGQQILLGLSQKLEITTGPPSLYLGAHLTILPDHSIRLSQQQYALDLLEKFNMSESRPVAMPADTGLYGELAQATRDENEPQVRYRELVGSLAWLANYTRPDICFIVSCLSRYLDKATKTHWTLAIRVLRYLRSTYNMSLIFPAGDSQLDSRLELDVFCDSDYAQDSETRRSVSGLIVKLSGAIISWRSSLQKSVSLSTCESELVSICEAVKTSQWLRHVLEQADFQVTVTVHADNTAAIRLVKGPELHAKSKHISIRTFYVRECYEANQFTIDYVPSAEQLADICTKPLAKGTFQRLRELIGLQRLTAN